MANSGLLQRGLFYGRVLSRDDHKRMDDAIAYKQNDKDEYRLKFDELANSILHFYVAINPETFKLKNAKFGRELIRIHKEKKRNLIYESIFNNYVQETLNTFINRIDEICIKLSYVDCYARGGDMPDETDITNSLRLLDKIFDQLVIWLEESIKDAGNKDNLNLYYRVQKQYAGDFTVKRAEVLRFMVSIMGCSKSTAIKKLETNFIGTEKIFTRMSDLVLNVNHNK